MPPNRTTLNRTTKIICDILGFETRRLQAVALTGSSFLLLFSVSHHIYVFFFDELMTSRTTRSRSTYEAG